MLFIYFADGFPPLFVHFLSVIYVFVTIRNLRMFFEIVKFLNKNFYVIDQKNY